MKLFMQGMRRSGTTIVFDILSQDPRLDLYYEPFSLGKVGALGGGSGMQTVDLMEKVRALRQRFCAARDDGLTEEDLNYGAPTRPEVELEASLPDYCADYLREMLGAAEHSAFKFTRVYRKARALHAICPDARFVLLLRHPQEVVASYMYGRDQKNRDRYADRESFFSATDGANPWNSRKLFRGILEQEGMSEPGDVPNWKRYLLLWKYTFDYAHRDGTEAFGEGFRVFRYEDLGRDPTAATTDLYHHLRLEPSPEAVRWAAANTRVRRKECFADDPRWLEAYRELGLEQSLERAGYAPVVAAG